MDSGVSFTLNPKREGFFYTCGVIIAFGIISNFSSIISWLLSFDFSVLDTTVRWSTVAISFVLLAIITWLIFLQVQIIKLRNGRNQTTSLNQPNIP